MHNFRELVIWKESLQLTKDIYRLVSELPVEEKYGLKSQIQRSATSIPSNIAEGSGRTTNKEFNYFLNIAIASSYELETQLLITKDFYNLKIDNILENLNKIQRMISGFRKTLDHKKST